MSSRRDNMRRIFVGNLPPDVRTRDLEDLFYKFGKICFIDLKTRRGPPFAFVEFFDYRDAEEAVRCRDGKDFDGCKLRVEFPRGRERTSRFKNGSGAGGRSAAPQRRSKFRVKVTGLPGSGSWQDLKDHMREVGEVCFADVYKGGEGVVEFVNYDDMRYAIRKLNNTKFKSHEGESSYIKLREDMASGDSRSRSRSPVSRRRPSPSYSPVTKRRDSHSISRSRSRSPKARKGGHRDSKRTSRRVARSRSRSKSASRSRSPHSRSPSASPRSARGSSRGSRGRDGGDARGSRDASKDRSRSRSPKSVSRSPRASSRGSRDRGSREGSRDRSRSISPKSGSRSPRNDRSPARSDKRSPSISRSPSPANAKSSLDTKEN